MSQDKLVLIRQALAAAESSIKTAKQLLSEVESGGLHVSAKDLPGEVGVFDGVSLMTEKGEKIEVPANYASKSMLVVGDTLKLVDENGEKRFKQIEHVKRHKTTGILHKKDGKFKVITPEGSYNVLGQAVEHFDGEVGDEVVLHLPAGNLTASYGAIEKIVKPGESAAEPTDQPQDDESREVPQVEVKPVEVKLPEPAREEVQPVARAEESARPKKKRKKPAGRKSEGPGLVSQPAPRSAAQVQQSPRSTVATPQPAQQPVVSIPAPGEDDELR